MKVLIGGDFTTTGQGEKAVKEGKVFSGAVLDLIKETDISILNLEAPVADISDAKVKKIGPHLRTTKNTIEYLSKCGIDIVTLLKFRI